MGSQLMNRILTAPLAVMLLLALGCGGGGGGGGGGGRILLDTNPGTDLVGVWTGTFSDQFGDFTVAMEIAADDLIPAGDPAWAEITWGEQSSGYAIQWGEFVEIDPGRYSLEYDIYDGDGNFVDTVTGELLLVDPDYAEGTFESTSGEFGEFSLALAPTFDQSFVAGRFSMAYSDPVTRDLYYLGEVEFDIGGNLLTGPDSYLTDDVEGAIDPGANVWFMTDGYLSVVDADTGYFEGELFFDSPDDTIFLAGYYGWDLGVFGGVFEDVLGGGLVVFIPVET